MKQLTKRVISASIAVPVIVMAYYNIVTFSILVSTIIFLSITEYFNIVRMRDPALDLFYYIILLFCGIFPVFFFAFFTNLGYKDLIVIYLIILFFMGLYAIIERETTTLLYRLGSVWLGIFYVGVNLSIFIPIYLDFGLSYALEVLMAVWVFDISAYFIGSNLGKHQLFPSISPHKTYEGLIGGFLGAFVFFLLYPYVVEPIFGKFYIAGWYHALLLAGMLSFTDTMGDLMESKMKRDVNIKDAGFIMPGHGGMLDRVDGLVFTVPFYFMYLTLFIGK